MIAITTFLSGLKIQALTKGYQHMQIALVRFLWAKLLTRRGVKISGLILYIYTYTHTMIYQRERKKDHADDFAIK